MFESNVLERLVEHVLGYAVDWDATGTWAQLAAALIALRIATLISRSELHAQRRVAKDTEEQFVTLVLGIARQAAGDIVTASAALREKAYGDLMRGGDGPRVPNTAANVMTLRGLDLNRMPSSEMALAVVQLRRLSGWGKNYVEAVQSDWRGGPGIQGETEEALAEWSADARAALRKVEVEAAKSLL